jgi:PPOX class probable F420-dependent enzyme
MPSRRELIRMTDAEVDEFLNGRHVVNIATFGPDGNIHLVAMWYGLINGHIAFETFSKSQKVKNLQRDPRITCLVEDGDGYEELRGVEIVGKAVLDPDPAAVVALATQVVERYYGVTDPEDAQKLAEVVAQKRTLVEVIPDKIVTWDHTKLGGTY